MEAIQIFKNEQFGEIRTAKENGELECVKRGGRNGRKLFSEKHLSNYLNSLKI